MKLKANWLGYPRTELVFICLPPFLCFIFISLFPNLFHPHATTSDYWWIILVLLVDVGHVYTTLYKTYFVRSQWKTMHKQLMIIPLLTFILALLLYQLGPQIFWRVIAYIAVFHFIRQQYGLLKVYSRKDVQSFEQHVQKFCIYVFTIYPMIYWHCYGPFEFNWFVPTDFYFFQAPLFEQIAKIIYFATLLFYGIYTLSMAVIKKTFNLPNFLIITGTALSWYAGIIYYKSDLTFTLFNIISHGIPYFAIVWIDSKNKLKKHQTSEYSWYLLFFKRYGLVLFLLIPLGLGYIEEGFWDSFVWKEHTSLFKPFYFTSTELGEQLKQLLIPLLILPQLTHYILDGFIWKISKGHLNEIN